MQERVCPKYGTAWYSADYTWVWVCKKCGEKVFRIEPEFNILLAEIEQSRTIKH